MTQQQNAKKSSPPGAGTQAPRSTEGTSGERVKDSLRGKDFEAQEAMVAPGDEDKQSPKGFLDTLRGLFSRKRGTDKKPKDKEERDPPAPEEKPKDLPAPLGSALVLSRDPKYAAPSYRNWFADKAATKIEPWGHTFDKSAVRVALDGETPVMALDWDTSWGTKPVSPIDLAMAPIEARAALEGVHALSGWTKVPGSDQPLVEALIGGETNAVSKAGRSNLAGKFAGLSKKTDEEQASTLTGLLGAKESAPSVVSETVETTPVTVTLTGPTEHKAYAFRGGPADAEIWDAAFSDGTKLKIVAPKAPDPALHQHTVKEAADAATYLPKLNRASINTVMLNPIENPEDKTKWAVEYKDPDFHSYMTAGKAGVVTIYPNAKKEQPGANYMRGTMIHETGHAWSYQNWGTKTTEGKWVEWKTCMTKDKNTVSGYAQASIEEDVAETIQVYGSTKGKPKYQEYKALVPARFAMLEGELG